MGAIIAQESVIQDDNNNNNLIKMDSLLTEMMIMKLWLIHLFVKSIEYLKTMNGIWTIARMFRKMIFSTDM